MANDVLNTSYVFKLWKVGVWFVHSGSGGVFVHSGSGGVVCTQ